MKRSTIHLDAMERLWGKDIKYALEKLFPYPEDMGPFEHEKYKVFVQTISNERVNVLPMSAPSSDVWHVYYAEK
jgi:hypothetical protein